MKILALDLSLTCWGICSHLGVSSWEPPGKGVHRLHMGWVRVEELLAIHDPEVVVIEGYSYASRQGSHQLGEMGGVVRLKILQEGVDYVEVSPSEVKKFAAGKGNANKEAVLTAAVRKLGYAGHSNDEADALWIWHMAQCGYGLGECTKVQREVASKVQWP